MPIEKLNVIVYKETDYDSVNPIVCKINELIEAHNKNEKLFIECFGNKSTQPKEEESELLSCPFCGGDSYLKVISNSPSFIECDSCFASSRYFDKEQEAINAWNSRK